MDWKRRRRVIASLFVVGIVIMLGLAGASVAFGLRATALNDRQSELRHGEEIIAGVLQALVDAETSVRGFVITADPDYLATYYGVVARISDLSDEAARNPLLSSIGIPQGPTLLGLIEARGRVNVSLIDTVRGDGVDAARKLLMSGEGKRIMDQIRFLLNETNEVLQVELTQLVFQFKYYSRILEQLIVGCISIAIFLSTVQFLLFTREVTQLGAVESNLARRNHQITLLSQLADALHSSNTSEENYKVVEAFARDILSGTSGCLYVYANSRDRLTRVARWGMFETTGEPVEKFAPDDCWGLRLGKPRTTSTTSAHMHCDHVAHDPPRSYMCLPITARGQTFGLLYLESPDLDTRRALDWIADLAQGFADQLSLALANIELRERMRNLAIKDPLTELYNRRFLDEVLGRELAMALRKGTKLSVAMIDIDHFKNLNDSFGHPTGDEVLKRVARTIVAVLRRSDIVCRYGGEEIAAVLPDCGITEAARKATELCEIIRSLKIRANGIQLPDITVSIGVASYPGSASDEGDLLACADQALYRAKTTGRDRVVVDEPDSGTVASDAPVAPPADATQQRCPVTT